tara:strand:- start:345 stop:1418 length:1074 start_codon:yes stop_codon:yes gene_type:complete
MRTSLLIGLVAMVMNGPANAAPVAETCTAAANAFLASLNAEQRTEAVRPFDHEGRKKWTNLPGSRFRDEGLTFGDMTEDQRKLGHRLVQCGLSSQGYQKVTGIMRVDDYLWSKIEDPSTLPPGFDFGSGYYWLGIFGDPAGGAPWGWQLDGHHLGLNFTVANGTIEVTPAFVGVQPNEIPDGPYAGWRLLGEEEDKAIALVSSFNASQRACAVIDDKVPDEIFTRPERGDALTEFIGLPASEMTANQRAHLQLLIEEYVNNMEPEAAVPLLKRIAVDGPAALHFSWMGGTSQGDAFYYRIHSPSILIEFDHTLNLARVREGIREPDASHIHTVMRQPGQDYGADLLRRHYEESHSDD